MNEEFGRSVVEGIVTGIDPTRKRSRFRRLWWRLKVVCATRWERLFPPGEDNED